MPTTDRRCGTCGWQVGLKCGAYTPQERKSGNLLINAAMGCRYWIANLTDAKCELCVYWTGGRCHKMCAIIIQSDPDFWCGEFVPARKE